jgi:indoleamine 2,3-dioxygenase
VLQKLQGDADEAWFVLVHVEIEAIADSVLSGLREATTGPEQDLVAALGQISQGIEDMRISLKSMYDGCSPDAYYNIVRPYIFGFDGVVFEGVPELDGQPQSFRGLAAAQSSVVPTIVAGLGIQHEQTALIRNLDDMKQFMPVRHQDLIFSYEKSNTRSVVAATAAGSDVRAAYNRCLEALIDFRQQHYTIVQEYIHQPSGETSKIGTGGTMYLVWLKQLIDETGEHVLH